MSKSQNILVLEDSSKVGFGGGQRISLEVINILLRTGSYVLVMDYSNHSFFSQKAEQLGAQVISYNTRMFRKKKLPNFLLFKFDLIGFIIEFVYSLQMIIKIANIIKQNSFDYTYSTTKKTFFIIALLSFCYKTFGSKIFHLHSYIKPSKLLNFIKKISNFLNFKVVVPSRFMQKILSNEGLMSIVISNFCDVNNSYSHTQLSKRKIDVLFAGGDQKWKGAIEYKKIVEYVLKKSHNDTYSFQASGYNKPQSFRLPIKSVEVKSLLSYLYNVRILIIPSQIPESFCISAIEAQTAGCMIIYNPVGALPEVCKNYPLAFAIPSNSNKEYANKVLELLKNVESFNLVKLCPTEIYSKENFENNILNLFKKK